MDGYLFKSIYLCFAGIMVLYKLDEWQSIKIKRNISGGGLSEKGNYFSNAFICNAYWLF
jgi:hypothetical protein